MKTTFINKLKIKQLINLKIEYSLIKINKMFIMKNNNKNIDG